MRLLARTLWQQSQDAVGHLVERVDFFRKVAWNLDVELLLEQHGNLDEVEAIAAQVVAERIGGL